MYWLAKASMIEQQYITWRIGFCWISLYSAKLFVMHVSISQKYTCATT